MKTHTTIGRDAINRAQQVLGADAEFLKCAKEIAHSRHERWDGPEYPQGLRGDAIPVAARGAHFDPDVVDAFVKVQHMFADIARRFADVEQD